MSEKRFKGIKVFSKQPNEIFIKDKEKDCYIRTEDEVVDLLNEQSINIQGLLLDRNRQEEKLDCTDCELINLQTRKIDSLEKENEQLKDENERLRLELETHKHPLWSTREAERKLSEAINNLANEIKKNGLLNEEINQLRIENMRLKKKGGDGV